MNKITKFNELMDAETICVHNNQFHADDVVCMALLRILGFKGRIVRTRDPEVLKERIGIDVQGSCTGGQFDHHGSDAAENTCALTKVWSFVRETAPDTLKTTIERFNQMLDPTFRAVAAIDSGSCRKPGDMPHMFAWVSLLNDGSDEQFFKAVQLATTILEAAWGRAQEWATTLEEARQAITWDGTPPVLDVERAGMKEALHSLGCEAPFFVSPHGQDWAVVQTCPPGQAWNPFGGSRVLPKAWGGLRDAELAAVCGYKSAKFAFNPGQKDVVMAFFGEREDAVKCAEEACK